MRATISFVTAKFKQFNEEIFASTLPEVPMRISRSARTLGALKYRVIRKGKEKQISDFSIWISGVFDLPEREIEDTVIHEMIHLYVFSNNLNDTSSHGKVFRTMMAAINQRHGRSITVSHRSSPENPTVYARSSSVKSHYIILTTFLNGEKAVTLCAATKIFEFHRNLAVLKGRDIKTWEWYYSRDPYFNKFPRSRTLKFYKLDPATTERISEAHLCVCDGRTIRLSRK